MASIDVPKELKEFNKIFQDLSYRHTDSTVFSDYLHWVIAQWSHTVKFDTSRYKTNELQLFFKLFQEHVNVMNSMVAGDGDWYDLPGTFYECGISSHSTRARSGQFFTPSTVVDFMTRIMGDASELTGKKLRINDPACGSGRFAIAFHANFPGNYIFCEDIDHVCVQMTAVNLMMHGAVGEVTWHDALDPLSFYGGYLVNSNLSFTGIPTIEELQKESSFIYKSGMQWMQSVAAEREQEKAAKHADFDYKFEHEKGELIQLTLF